MPLSLATRAVLADIAGLFWSEAAAVDAGEVPVTGHLDALAGAGFYGASAPQELGGLGLGFLDVCEVVEELASSCLASTFVWVQHLRLLRVVTDPEVPALIRQPLQAAVIKGQVKGGVALTGLMPGPVRLLARPADQGWHLDGEAPWVSGWGIIDMLYVAARSPSDEVVTLVAPAHDHAGLTAVPLRLGAADASHTVRLHFEEFFVPAKSVLGAEPYEQARLRGEQLRLNGSFALGITRRCTALLGPSPLDAELAACRSQLDRATPELMFDARAAASALAVKAAHALAVHRGSRSALAGDVAERLTREAAFLLVFGTRPLIAQSLLDRFGGQLPEP